MPANSLIVGVDLAPIKPIPRTITFQSDITTDKCRATIRQHLKTWKADTVLHDGAPNVGTAWVQDAFSQAELALQAMKLATEFLIEGGTFVTKVFRSKDYNALLWVFNQLFTKVEATKPPSSRNVSAEIFVVCRGFKAPKRIDPKFLDPRSVFAELTDPTPNHEAKVFNPEKKKRKRDGYEEGDYTQFKEAPASEFIQTSDPIAMLGSLNKLSFEQKGNGDIALSALDQLPGTTVEIRDCCADLKVLGRKEFRMLLKWRLKAREKFGFTAKKRPSQHIEGEEVAEIEPMDEELQIQEELQKLNEKESSRKKRERRRENERKQKEIIRMQMHMMPPTEIGLEQAGPDGEDAMFALRAVDRAGAVDKVARGKMGLVIRPQDRPGDADTSGEEESDPEEDRLERELDTLYVRYQEKKSEPDAKYRAKKARKEHKDGEWEGFSEDAESGADEIYDDQDSEGSSDVETSNVRPLITTLGSSKDEKGALTRRATMFFDQDIFRNIGALEAEAGEDSAIDMNGTSTGEGDGDRNKPASLNEDKAHGVEQATASQPAMSTARLPFSTTPGNTASTSGFSADDTDKDNVTDFEVVKDSGGSEWELQDEPRKDGRLGRFRTYMWCFCPYALFAAADDEQALLTEPSYRHYHRGGYDLSPANSLRRKVYV